MKKNDITAKIVRLKTWFALEAVVEEGTSLWHKAGFGRFLIPHPPLISWLLRLRLPIEAKNRAGLTHEFGHLQSFPFYLLYTMILIIILIDNGDKSLTELIIAFISTHAVWEIFAELYTIFHLRSNYKLYYKGISILPRLLFWIMMTALALSGWAILLL